MADAAAVQFPLDRSADATPYMGDGAHGVNICHRRADGASLVGRKQVPIAFAAWSGANQERDGFKAVTLDWWQLSF